jgi:flagellar protein FlaJ
MYAAVVSVVITIAVAALMLSYGLTPILAILLGVGCFFGLFNKFIQYPLARSTVVGKEIEKDILFAARDLVISMRSGMPLFNAITAVSTGYGAASLEFAKVVELVQLGSPIEQALDDVSSKSQSKTFKRIMLQATVSLKAGADVVGALQGVVEEVQQERVIELRRYGQRLNALAMFYMLFGVIFPSMGIAVAAILTTFINLFSITNTTLLMAIVGILFLQIVFLNIMRGSRPVFAM